VTLLATDINRPRSCRPRSGVSTASGRFEGCRTDMRGVFFRPRSDGLRSRAPCAPSSEVRLPEPGRGRIPIELNNTSAMDLIVCRNVLSTHAERAAASAGPPRTFARGRRLARLPPRSSGCRGGRCDSFRGVRLADVGFLRKAAPDPSCHRGSAAEAARAVQALAAPGQACPALPLANADATAAEEDAPSTTHLLSIAEHATSRRRTWQGAASLGTPAMRWRWLFLRAFHANLGRLDAAARMVARALEPRNSTRSRTMCIAKRHPARPRPPQRGVVSLERALSSIRTSRWPITHLAC